MASIIEGYNYDVFISYRQKDNKYDGWVSDFVEHLKGELESTFKEDINVYFDINPHDGLLETHDVDASLEEKLKCLVFIPIVSRTYCDPKSFAWEHEFKAFIKYASEDRFGLKITLPNGNVSSRILPVRIHELNLHDSSLIENILGGPIRGIDFVYKSAGVNRPLRKNEDHPDDNLNKTVYRDQINKVANAIDDIISGLRYGVSDPSKINISASEYNLDKEKRKGRISNSGILSRISRKNLFFGSLAIICLFVVFIFWRRIYNDKTEKSIALIPLRVIGDEKSLVDQGDNFIEALNDKLSLIKSLSVAPRISTLPYRDAETSIEKISRELKINFLVDGNIRMEDGRINIWIELSAAKDRKTLWSKKYFWDKSSIPDITREVVRNISRCLKIRLSDEELSLIGTELTSNPDANLNYISANVISNDAWFYYNYGEKTLDSIDFVSAIKTYSKAIEFDSLFAQAYARRAAAIAWGFYTKQLDSTYINRCKIDIDKALALDNDLYDASIAQGFYYYYCKNDLENAIRHFREAAGKNPDEYRPLFYMAMVYRRMGNWKASQDLIHRVIKFNPQEPLFLTNIGLSYEFLHDYDSALIYHQKAIDLMPDWAPPYKNKLQTILLKNGKTSEAKAIIDAAMRQTGDNMVIYNILLNIYKRNFTDALGFVDESLLSDFRAKGEKQLYLALINRYMNNAEVAKKYFDSTIVIMANELNSDPGNYYNHAIIGIAFAGIGKKDVAVEQGKMAVELSDDNIMDKIDMILNLAKIYTMTGEHNSAMEHIRYLINNPSSFSGKMLQLDPIWDPLMNLRGYQTLITGNNKNH